MLENTQCLPSWTSEQINHYNLLVYCCALLNNFFSLWILPVATSHSGWQGLNSKHEHLSSFGLGHSTWTSDFLCLGAVWGIRAWSNPPLASILASSTDLKRFKLHTVCLQLLEQIQPLQLDGRVQVWAAWASSPCLSPGNHWDYHSQSLFQKIIKDLTAFACAARP